MAIRDDTLYVVDFDRLRIIDLPSGKISMTIRLPEDNPGLNDVTLSPDGEVFVTASNIKTVYQLVEVFAKQGPPLALRPWLVSEKLSHANGIWADEDSIWVAAWHLYRIDRTTLQMHGPIGVDQGLEDLESIESDGAGGFLHHPDRAKASHVPQAGKHQRAAATRDLQRRCRIHRINAATGGALRW